tara:strand:- start:2534 stop:2686 length:153 start_codon:yes stop_codon:yes gene_type:complete
MMSCLLVYAALAHKIRKELKGKSAYFPNFKYKPCQNPTLDLAGSIEAYLI